MFIMINKYALGAGAAFTLDAGPDPDPGPEKP
jgi:hypothetical protein